MKTSTGCLALALLALPLASQAREANTGPTPAVALRELTDGNGRYATNHTSHPHQNAKTMRAVAKEQHPFAAILSCADSRVPPEVIFDEGLGDLFVVRVAGNIVDDAVEGSLEYAVEHLGVPLIVVLGHTRCGAVDATVKGGEPHTHIESLVKAIQPAVAEAKQQKGDLLDNAVRENVRRAVKQLRESQPILNKQVEERHLEILGAIYNLDTGKIEYLK